MPTSCPHANVAAATAAAPPTQTARPPRPIVGRVYEKAPHGADLRGGTPAIRPPRYGIGLGRT
jgi:hypothetical protein